MTVKPACGNEMRDGGDLMSSFPFFFVKIREISVSSYAA